MQGEGSLLEGGAANPASRRQRPAARPRNASQARRTTPADSGTPIGSGQREGGAGTKKGRDWRRYACLPLRCRPLRLPPPTPPAPRRAARLHSRESGQQHCWGPPAGAAAASRHPAGGSACSAQGRQSRSTRASGALAGCLPCTALCLNHCPLAPRRGLASEAPLPTSLGPAVRCCVRLDLLDWLPSGAAAAAAVAATQDGATQDGASGRRADFAGHWEGRGRVLPIAVATRAKRGGDSPDVDTSRLRSRSALLPTSTTPRVVM